jgi:hypothetical protein
MLTITIPSVEYFDEEKEEFGEIKEQKITLEHSLKSISKWESKWHKPFLSNDAKTAEEALDYIKCMTLTQNVKDEVYNLIPESEIERITEYIEDPMTATTVRHDPSERKHGKQIVTSEVIYYDMVALNIPFECERWHLNRLLMLIEVCAEKNKPPKKMSKRDIMNRNKSLNAARRKKLHSNG